MEKESADKKITPIDRRPQSEKFEQVARELGCDESEEAFNAALKKVARHKPTEPKKETKPDRDPSER